MPEWKSLSVMGLLAIFLLAPTLSVVSAYVLTTRTELVEDPIVDNISIRVGSAQSLQETQANLHIEYSKARPGLRSSGLEGLVTASRLSPGAVVVSGDSLYQVGAIEVLGAHTPAPFFRSLQRGSEGPDVEALANFLVSLSLHQMPADAPSDTFGYDLDSAVRSFEEKIGATRTGVFQPSYVVWLPDPSFEVGSSAISVANLAPSLGEVIAEGAITITAAQVEYTTANPAIEDPASYVAKLESGVELNFRTDGVRIRRSDYDKILMMSDGQMDLLVTVSRRTPLTLATLPASAIIEVDGKSCVVSTAPEQAAKLVEIVGGTPTLVYVQGIEPGEEVLGNPSAEISAECTALLAAG